MGRQVGFYMTKSDEAEFLTFVRSTGEVVVLPYMSLTPEFEPVKILPEPFSEAFWNSFRLYNRDVSKRLVTEYVPQQSYYVVDELRASVIEFSRCIPKGSVLSPGRIWAQFDYLDRERMVLIPKEPAFREWYEIISRWLRKNYEKVLGDHYAGPGAIEFVEKGGSLAEM